MKKIGKGILLALTILLAAGAVYTRILVSGESLLTISSRWGYVLAVSYRYIGLAAVLFFLLSICVFLPGVLSFFRKKKAGRKT